MSSHDFRYGDTFKGLPGLLADCLPDKSDNLLIDQWLTREGRTVASFSPVERLCYLGSRAMGALEFLPTHHPDQPARELQIEALVHLANSVLADRQKLKTTLIPEHQDEALCALGHYDFNTAGGYSYEQAFQLARRLGLAQPNLPELYRPPRTPPRMAAVRPKSQRPKKIPNPDRLKLSSSLRVLTVVRICDEITVDIMVKACDINYEQAKSEILWRTIDNVRIPFASPKLLWWTKESYREKDQLDRLHLAKVLRAEGSSVPPTPLQS